MKKKYKLVVVTWMDANMHEDVDKRDQWQSKTAEVQQVGWLISRGIGKEVWLAHAIDSDGKMDIIAIPEGCIKEIKVIR